MAPAGQLLDGVLAAFGNDLHSAVTEIAGPPGDAQAVRFVLARSAEEHALHATGDE